MGQYLPHEFWIWSSVGLATTIAVALIAHHLFFAMAKRITARSSAGIGSSVVRHGKKPAQLILPLLAVLLVLPVLPLRVAIQAPIRHLVGLGLIASVGWLLITLMNVFEDFVALRHSIDVRDNLAARRLRTQVDVLRRVSVTIIVVVTLAVMLMTFPEVRLLGQGLVASAGLAALVGGLAARSTMTNLIAGMQVAITQPIRLDDVVIVEGEWGWIEEIRTTYVVVRIWDLRRLIVPLSYFIEKPFQNWTRNTADLLGTVLLYTDYTVSVEAVRAELHRILKSSDLWNGEVWGLQVTDATEKTLQLRALMSASDSSTAWDLRCYVREELIRFLQDKYPRALPRIRAEIQTSGPHDQFIDKNQLT